METNLNRVMEGTAAFQKMWIETTSRLTQAGFTMQPGSTAPDTLRQVRGGLLTALSESWAQFLESSQFQEGMRQWMDQAVGWRKATNDVMVHIRKEMQAPSGEDIDSVMLTVRHMEQRLLNRLDELSKRVELARDLPAATYRPRKAAGRGKPRASGMRSNGKGAKS